MKIWNTVLFQKKDVEKGTTTRKTAKKICFYVNVPTHARQKNFFSKIFFIRLIFILFLIIFIKKIFIKFIYFILNFDSTYLDYIIFFNLMMVRNEPLACFNKYNK
jgi:hypothetical protein